MRLAVEHVRRMNGGAQAHLMRCDDNAHYVVKFKNNPQHLRILANEMFATRLANRMGLCVPDVDAVEVRAALIKNTPALVMEMRTGRFACSTGAQFGSRYQGSPSTVTVSDFIPNEQLCRIENIKDFLGVLVFDKWTCNTDKRQAVFVRRSSCDHDDMNDKIFRATMIDQGFCFDGGNWNFPDAPLRGLYTNHRVYRTVVGIESFEPWLGFIENGLSLDILYEEAERVPLEWCGGDRGSWTGLVERLYKRRTHVRELIWSALNAVPDAFPNWKKRVSPGSVRFNILPTPSRVQSA